MASSFCGFNLHEVCRTAIAYLEDPGCDLLATLPAPDFPTGGQIIVNPDAMRRIYETGRGSFPVRSKWQYVKKEHLIEITEIPYTTTIEAIMDKVAELVKGGKIREISDMRDETDLSGLKIAIDLKRGADPDKLMQKLFRLTPLMDSCACNFNVLINGMPGCWACAAFWRNGPPGAPSRSSASCSSRWARRRRNCTCSRV